MKKLVKKNNLVKHQEVSVEKVTDNLFNDIRALINSAKSHVARTVDTGLVMLNWYIGNRIRKDILGEERAPYGEQIISTLSKRLILEYGRGYSEASLSRMMSFTEKYPDKQILASLTQKLSWSHFRELITIKDSLKRDFYTEMCRIEGWNYRILERKIDSMLFERCGLSRKPKDLARKELELLKKEDLMTPDIAFRDPYFLDFLGLKNTFAEKDLEAAIIAEMEQFILEIGSDFAFMARQKRMMIDGNDFYLDLLFYHRGLKRLVAMELKLDDFKAEYKGQMELYLRWLEKYEMRPGENKPLGLILCGKKNHEQIELLNLDESGIRVSEYWTELPSKAILEKKLHEMIELNRKLLRNRKLLEKGTDK